MAACDRHFDRALHMPLPLHVTEIDLVTLMCVEKGGQIAAGRLHCDLAAVELESLPKISDTVDVDPFHHCRFMRVRFRNEDRLFTTPPRFQRHWQHAFHRTDRSIEGQLANKAEFFEG